MSDIETEKKINLVIECLEIMGLKILALCLKASDGKDLQGFAEIARFEAEKRNEIHIAEKMRMI